MNLKNIVLNTTDLGFTEWEDVRKLQLGKDGYICIIDFIENEVSTENGKEKTLKGIYFNTEFQHEPTYKEIINYIISKEYPNGKEQQLLRLGIKDPENAEYTDYYNNVEDIKSTIKNLLTVN